MLFVPHKRLRRPQRIFRKRNMSRSMATQVNELDIDMTFESMCEDPDTSFDTYNNNALIRKKQKYKNLFIAGHVQKISCATLCKPISYIFAPQTIHKNSRYF
uniref:Uncharacterized protein n=1 Tax=Bactrocera latifrons TaxID=174628 RepID=A0A0K8UW83_BACLA